MGRALELGASVVASNTATPVCVAFTVKRQHAARVLDQRADVETPGR